METGLSSPADREDRQERLPDREAHLIIVPPKGSDDFSKGVRRLCRFAESPSALLTLQCMARRPRFVLPGVAHHVTQRGNNRQTVFHCDHDRTRYLEILRERSIRHDVRILGWCLMTNHVHFIAIPGTKDSLARVLGQAHSQYSIEQNRE